MIGPPKTIESVLAAHVAEFRSPIWEWTTKKPLPSPGDVATALIREVATLRAIEQQAWMSWLSTVTPHRRQVVATSSMPVFPLVTAGRFSMALYYRLNIVLWDFYASAGNED
jgi:hypothetical protein